MQLFLLLPLFAGAFAANILVFNPTLGYSHVKFLGNIAEVLAREGHNVTILSPIFDRNVEPFRTVEPNIVTIGMRKIGETVNFSPEKLSYMNPWGNTPIFGLSVDPFDFLYMVDRTQTMFNAILKETELTEELKMMSFDLAIIEPFSYTLFGIIEAIGIEKVVAASSLGTFPMFFEVSGLPRFPSFVPEFVITFHEKMSFLERVQTLIVNVLGEVFLRYDLFLSNAQIRKFHPRMPDLHSLMMKKTGLVLSNVNEFTESPRPYSRIVQEIGGASIYLAKHVSKNFDRMLNERPSTVIFSLGTVTDTCSMPKTVVKECLDAFSEFPEVTFLWKFNSCGNESSIFQNHPNVLRVDWMPITDLLADPRVKVFINHGGMNSINEAVFRGKPVITIPLFGDQFVNSGNAVNRGFGIMIRKEDLSKEVLVSALNKTLDPSGPYFLKTVEISKILNGREDHFRQEIVRRVNLFLEFGTMEHLRLPVDNLNFFQLHSVDSAVFVIAFCLSFLFVSWKFLQSPQRTEIQKKFYFRPPSSEDDFDDVFDVFVYSAYYYNRSESLGDNSVAVVFTADFDLVSREHLNFEISSASERKRVPATIQRITPHSKCRWIDYIAVFEALPNTESVSLDIGSRSVPIPISLPSTKYYDVVTCIAPLYASEQWQIAIVAAHIYKRFGSHMHLYARSIVTPMFQLIKEYDKQGYLTLQPWHRVHLSDVPFEDLNPSINVEFRNQAAAQTDCLLKYKESAAFISFVDLDDLLIPKIKNSYFEEFHELFNIRPHIAYLQYWKENAHAVTRKSGSHFSLTEVLSSIQFEHKSETGKHVVQPKFVNASWIHWPPKVAHGMSGYQVPSGVNAITHLKHFTRIGDNESVVFMKPLLKNLDETFESSLLMTEEDVRAMEEDFQKIRGAPGMLEVMKTLPRTFFYSEIISKCYESFYQFFYSGQLDRLKCFGPERCQFPLSPGILCHNAVAQYESYNGAELNVHFARTTNFEQQDGCIR